MNTSEVPREVLEQAMKEVYSRLENFPEDEWLTLNENFELNLWIQEDEFRHQMATVYEVIDGEITDNFVRIWQQHILDNEYKQFQLEQNAQMEADWLARNESHLFADRALDNVPNEVDIFDDNDYEPLGMTMSRYNPHGIFTVDGRQVGSSCGCEDYPCCGH